MRLEPTRLEAYQLLHDGALAFAQAEQVGMRTDLKYCKQQQVRLTNRIRHLEHHFKVTRFYHHWHHYYQKRTNIYSNEQLAHLLYHVRKYEPVKLTRTGQGATDEESLEQLRIPELNDLIQCRKLKRLRDTYLEGVIRESVGGFMHPFFNLHPVRTYRSSSDLPNFHNFPVRDEEAMQICRRAILPRLGHQLFEPDCSGIEVRISCCYHHDPKLIDDVLHGDMHKDMAIELYVLDDLDKGFLGEYNMRQGAKNGFVFPEFYGSYYANCANNLIEWARRGKLKDGTPTLVHLADKRLVRLRKDGTVSNIDRFVQHVKKVEDDFWNVRYRVYTRWKKKWWADYQRRGYIDLHTGFRCGGLMSRNDCINYPIQGSAFHCLLWSFIEIARIARKRHWDSRLVGQIHDSMTLDIHPDELEEVVKVVVRVTCQDLPAYWKWIIIPIKIEAAICDVDKPWSTKHSYELPEVA